MLTRSKLFIIAFVLVICQLYSCSKQKDVQEKPEQFVEKEKIQTSARIPDTRATEELSIHIKNVDMPSI